MGKGRTQSRYYKPRARLLLSIIINAIFCIVFLTCLLSFAFSLLTLRCIFLQSRFYIHACNSRTSICVWVCACAYIREAKISHTEKATKICVWTQPNMHTYEMRICTHSNTFVYVLKSVCSAVVLLLLIFFLHSVSTQKIPNVPLHQWTIILPSEWTHTKYFSVKFSVELRSVTLLWDSVKMCVILSIDWIGELFVKVYKRSRWKSRKKTKNTKMVESVGDSIYIICIVINNRIHNKFDRVTSENVFIEIAISLSFYK